MTGWQPLALIGAVALGVLLPKALPAALVGGHVGGRLARFLELLSVALLAGLTAVSALGGEGGLRPRPAVVLAVVVGLALAVLTRRSLLAMAGGWAALAAAVLLTRP